MAKSIERELRDALNVNPDKDENRQKFLSRLRKAATSDKTCPDDIWKSLSESAQAWVNAATDAYDADKPLPEPDGKAPADNTKENDVKNTKAGKGGGAASGKDKGGGSRAPAKDDKDKGGAKAGASKGGTRTPARSAAPARSSSGGGAKAGKSKRRQMKEIIVKKPTVSNEELIGKFGRKALGKDGLSDVSITSMRGDTLDTLKVAELMGFWKGPKLTKE